MRVWLCSEGAEVIRGAEAYDKHVLLYPKHHPRPVGCLRCGSDDVGLSIEGFAVCERCGFTFYPEEKADDFLQALLEESLAK